jgi:hypothetical protein
MRMKIRKADEHSYPRRPVTGLTPGVRRAYVYI